jgi:hypothetical protein
LSADLGQDTATQSVNGPYHCSIAGHLRIATITLYTILYTSIVISLPQAVLDAHFLRHLGVSRRSTLKTSTLGIRIGQAASASVLSNGRFVYGRRERCVIVETQGVGSATYLVSFPTAPHLAGVIRWGGGWSQQRAAVIDSIAAVA